MKHIGFTKDGRQLIEISKAELEAFNKLSMALEGKTWVDVSCTERHNEFPDFATTFGVIELWGIARMKINEFQRMIDKFKEILDEAN